MSDYLPQGTTLNYKATKSGNQNSSGFLKQDRLFYSCFAREGVSLNAPLREALVNTTRDALRPYHDFLTAAIDAEKQRGEYECRFRIITKSKYKLDALRPRHRAPIPRPYLVFDKPIGQLKEQKNRLYLEERDQTISFDVHQAIPSRGGAGFMLAPEVEKSGLLFADDMGPGAVELNAEPVAWHYEHLELVPGDSLEFREKAITIAAVEKMADGWILDLEAGFNGSGPCVCKGFSLDLYIMHDLPEQLYPFINGRRGNPWPFEVDGEFVRSDTEPPSGTLVDGNGQEYRCIRLGDERGDIIELIDDEAEEGELSASDHFFMEDELAIYQGDKAQAWDNRFEVWKTDADERRLYVRPQASPSGQAQKRLDPSQPIRMHIDTANLERQRSAIRALLLKPVLEQRSLIKLFEKKDLRKLWELFNWNYEVPEEWYVLKDSGFPGTITQRNFVQKALATPDFVLLEGPPGSGKTTAILELILQLVARGQRVLLAASTHVAIDNVLERIPEDSLVVPVRIGRNESVGEGVTRHQLSSKTEVLIDKGLSREAAERCVLDSANLVCGTTMGLQNHPDIRAAGDRKEDRPVEPRYDCLILDEASKTTFQEFLVPALHARKWIIVGDIQQLSPYSDAAYLRHSLASLLDPDFQSALRHLQLFMEKCLDQRMAHYLACEMPSGTIKALQACLVHDRSLGSEGRYGNLRVANSLDGRTWSNAKEPGVSLHPAALYGCHVLVFAQGTWPEVKTAIPETHSVIVNTEISEQEAFRYRQALLDSKTGGYEARKDFLSGWREESRKSWPDEVAWRMIRAYERRNLKEPSYFERSLDLLMPAGDEKSLRAIELLRNLFFPSVLESLQKGNGERHRNATTITDGFGLSDAFSCRFERLDYQHRMHPEISSFSRQHFYSGNDGFAELKDSPCMDRNWEYKRYPCRAVWIPVRRPAGSGERDNKNASEVRALMRELQLFVDWAGCNAAPADDGRWQIAVLTYYRPQEGLLREALRKFCKQATKYSLFSLPGVRIQLFTVDRFQGREADVVFLSMVRNQRIGFMDNTNRLNVALTRARYQRVILGNHEFFLKSKASGVLNDLARQSEVFHCV